MAGRGLTRRQAMAGGALAALASRAMARAAATRAHTATGTIRDVEHIVILMQENRSFDHYFGCLAGVRGFADPWPAPSAEGSVWRQADGRGGMVSPFRFDVNGSSFPVMRSLPHDFETGHAAWNGGAWDRWVPAKGPLTMGYVTREDIPFHAALADNFTVCDAYFSSLLGPTCPNRLFMMTGSNDPHGRGGAGPVIDCSNITQVPDGTVIFSDGWTTYPERLQAAGVSWQAYRQGIDPYSDDDSDGGMNVLLSFDQYRRARPGDPLYDRGVAPRRLDQLRRDVEDGTLAQVSWIFPPRLFSEHPKWPPAYGLEYMARVLDALTANPDVWSRTVLLIAYDENDGFFDHMVPPMPPLSPAEGESTVSVEGERHEPTGAPYGLGGRVPALAISPFSRGGYVCSDVLDHTSLIRFVEARFGVVEPNISPWRRAVCGDFTAAFDFQTPNSTLPRLPDRRRADAALKTNADFHAYRAVCNARPKPHVPADFPAPPVEPGGRPIRPLGYDLRVHCRSAAGQATVTLHNQGHRAAALTVFDHLRPGAPPRRFTLGEGRDLSAIWPLKDGRYDLMVLGPQGFAREFRGASASSLQVEVSPEPGLRQLRIAISNPEDVVQDVNLRDRRHGSSASVQLPPGAKVVRRVPLLTSDHWYDVAVEASGFAHRFAGHVETGRPSRSDLSMARRRWQPA